MSSKRCLRFLSVDLFRTLIVPKESIAATYANFGQMHLDYQYNHSNLIFQFTNVYEALERQWPNFGQRDNISSAQWWNEIIIQTLTRSSPYTEAYVRGILNLHKTNQIYDFFASEDAWQLMPNALQGLNELANAGIHMCILSNSDERTPMLVKNLGIDRFFKFVFYSSCCGFMKPDREIYELVNNRFCKLDGQSGTDLKMRMAEYAHVGDSEIRDYWGSLRAGCGRSFLLKPCIKCKDRSLEECKDAFYTPCCSDSFTSWVYSHSNASRSLGKIPSRHIVNSLTELASLVTFQNNSRPHDDTKQ